MGAWSRAGLVGQGVGISHKFVMTLLDPAAIWGVGPTQPTGWSDKNKSDGLNRPHHNASPLDCHHFDRGATLNQSAFGDDIHPLSVDPGNSRRT